MNPFIAQTPTQFIRKVALDYLRYGYWCYALREIPEGKDLATVDQKLIDYYDITTCRTRRARNREKGLANVVFVRYKNHFVLLATDGVHEQFEKLNSYDIRMAPLHFHDYSVGMLRGKPSVQVAKAIWQDVERRFQNIALHHKNEVECKVNALPYANFPGVYTQKLALLSQINRKRKRAGLPLVKLEKNSKKKT